VTRSFTRAANSGSERRASIDARLESAVEKLLGDGWRFSELSVERIAATAGLSRSSFYRYHPDKGALLIALTDDVISSLSESGQNIWANAVDTDRAELRRSLGKLLELGWRHRLVLGAIAEAEAYDADVRARRAGFFDDAVAYVTGAIEAGQRTGRTRPELDAAAVARWLCLMVDRGLVSTQPPPSRARVERRARALAEIIWCTLHS
jgi:AcrR family transcriptional regulator